MSSQQGNDGSRTVLSKNFELTLQHKTFKHTYTYQAPVMTGSGGNVFGGGTRTGANYKKGFQITVRNLEDVVRDYFFAFALFADEPNKIVLRTFNTRIKNVQPGYAMIEDIEPNWDEKEYDLFLEKLQVVDRDNQATEEFLPHWRLVEVAQAAPKAQGGGCGKAIVKLIALFVGLSLISSIGAKILSWFN